MAYSYEYPYVDPHRYNSDWIIRQVADLQIAPRIEVVVVGDPITPDLPVGSIVVAFTDNFKTSLHGVYVKGYSVDNDNYITIWEE